MGRREARPAELQVGRGKEADTGVLGIYWL